MTVDSDLPGRVATLERQVQRLMAMIHEIRRELAGELDAQE